MDVWMTWAKRKVPCRFCPEEIGRGTPVVVTKAVTTKEGRTFTRMGRYHPQCWISQGLAYLEKHPVVYLDGRPKLVLSEEDHSRRVKLLQRRATLMHRYRRSTDRGDIIGAVGYYIQALELRPLIEPLGGVPASWKLESPGEDLLEDGT